MFPDLNGQLGARLIIATIVVALALLLFFLASRAWRNRGTRTFLRGGHNRQPRLAVLDAAAVDAKRRLVLVRRDEIEHLILIGGPTDIVVESRIGAEPPATAQPRPAPVAAWQAPTAETEGPARKREAPARLQSAAAAAMPERVVTSTRDALAAPVERAPAAAEPTAPKPQRPVATPAEAAVPEIEPELTEPETAPHEPADLAVPAPAVKARETPAADVAALLDGERERVFGSPAAKQDSPYVRAYTDDATPEPTRPAALPKAAFSASILRFDDFLDTEVAGDLSKVTPAEAEKPAEKPVPSLRDVRAASSPARHDNALDDEMARLLGEIAPKR